MTDSSYYDPRDAFVRFGTVVIRTASILAVNLEVPAIHPSTGLAVSYVEIVVDDGQALRLFDDAATEARKWFTSDRVSTP